MLQVIGKTYSNETQAAKQYLDHLGVKYDYIDLDLEPDWGVWFKKEKVLGLPALRANGYFMVGSSPQTMDRFLRLCRLI